MIIVKGIKAEFLKIKGTFTYWFALASAILIPIINFLTYFFRYESFIPKNDVNIWNQFFNANFSVISILLFPFYIILTIALNLNLEHKENSWKKLLLLPISRNNIYLTKALFLLLQIIISLSIFLLSFVFCGFVLGIIHPELKFLESSFNLFEISILLFRLFISILGIFSIQYLVSLFLNNVIIPISFGTFLVITALVITTRWENSFLFPYSFPSLSYYKYVEMVKIKSWNGIYITEYLSIVIFLVVISLGLGLFKRKQIR